MKNIEEILIEKLTEINKKISDVNSGGCGIVSYAICKWLKQQGYDSSITMCYEDSNNKYEYNTIKLANNNCMKASCAHVTIRFNGNDYDSNGIHNIQNYNKLHQNVTMEQLLPAINNSDEIYCHTWNDIFIRSKGIPKLEKILGIDLKEIEL